MEVNPILTLQKPDTIVVTSVEVLKQAFVQWAGDQEQQKSVRDANALIGRNEVESMLKVSPTTLWRWHNAGILVPQRIGGKNLYRKSDVEHLMSR